MPLMVQPRVTSTARPFSRSMRPKPMCSPRWVSRASRKASVSAMCRRIHSPTGPISSPTRKGTRHPQASSASGESPWVTRAPMPEPANTARHWPNSCQAPYSPRRWAGALSTRKAVALPYSPPVAKPWSIRATTISSGAPRPMAA